MNKPKLTALAALLTTALAASASAQTVEIGVGIGGVRVDGSEWWGRSVRSPGVDGSLTFPFNDRFAIESYVTYGRRTIPVTAYGPLVSGGDTDVTEGLYGVVVRQRVFHATNGFDLFVNYGLGGSYNRQSVPERQYLSGRTVVTLPASTSNQTEPLWLPVGGVAVQKQVAPHLAIRADGQVTTFFGVPIGGRGSVGLVVGIGRR